NRGVKKAPFVVLIGANMPSILAEISFVSNPNDERKLQKPDYRQRIAESLYRGVAKDVGGLSRVKLAAKTAPGDGESLLHPFQFDLTPACVVRQEHVAVQAVASEREIHVAARERAMKQLFRDVKLAGTRVGHLHRFAVYDLVRLQGEL